MTKIKVCGITTLNDAHAAIVLGANLIGFNFYPMSPRFIEKNSCAEISSELKLKYPQIKLVGVFVNSSVEDVNEILETCSLDLAQLHGDEPPEVFSVFSGRAFKAFRGIPDDVTGYEREEAPVCLVDAAVKGLYGGSGVTADWDGAAEMAKKYPLLLAGGLTPENVAEAVRRVKPWGVDVASGVESAPGKKDATKLSAFVKAVKGLETKE
ncbi:MAG TPA: N-(5'-phosphoribosyl)anthranilate isomerase [Anaerolineae bacterium]|nr:N-(5'-phosphoribosyl)anthranilate isomerase [Anaerolineae bacterium]